MKFKASQQQIVRIFTNAVRTRLPHVTILDVANEITFRDGNLFADYICGVEVRLYFYYQGNGEYEISENIDPSRQIWSAHYTSVSALVESAL